MAKPQKAAQGTARTMAMKGGGYYSQRTRGAKDVIDNAAGMLVEAADAISPPDKGRPIILADFAKPFITLRLSSPSLGST